MDDAVRTKLKGLLTASNRDELLNDPRRLAELVRERLGNDRRREALFLNTVMEEGVPKRLLSMPATSITRAMIANYANKVSKDTALEIDIARSAIETWAGGLGLKIYNNDGQPNPVRDDQALVGKSERHPTGQMRNGQTAKAPSSVLNSAAKVFAVLFFAIIAVVVFGLGFGIMMDPSGPLSKLPGWAIILGTLVIVSIGPLYRSVTKK